MTVRRFAWIALLTVASLIPGGPLAQAPAPLRVLFIGNSLTEANQLGSMIEALARGSGGPFIETRTVAYGGYSLEDHWNGGEARRTLAAGGWSTVVLQQGPSSQPDSSMLLDRYVRQFDREARKVHTSVALFMVWPPRSGPGTFDQVAASYTRAAQSVHGLLLPVGRAFRAALEADPRAPLFLADGFHPTVPGTYLAAAVIYQHLSGRRTPFIPATLAATDGSVIVTIPPQTVRSFEAAAVAATER